MKHQVSSKPFAGGRAALTAVEKVNNVAEKQPRLNNPSQRDKPFGLCPLCRIEGELVRKSHVLPRWAVKLLLESDPHLFALKGGDVPSVNVVQDALYEPLFCKECEQRLNRWDEPAHDLVVTPGVLSKPSRLFRSVKNQADYDTLKLFQLSVLWRAHLSQQRFFRRVNLGQRHAERLRTRLWESDPGPPTEYPCIMASLTLDGQPDTTLISLPVLYAKDAHHLYVFSFAGLLWAFVVSSHAHAHPLADWAVQPNGEFRMGQYEIRGAALGDHLSAEVFGPTAALVDRFRTSRERRSRER